MTGQGWEWDTFRAKLQAKEGRSHSLGPAEEHRGTRAHGWLWNLPQAGDFLEGHCIVKHWEFQVLTDF